MTLEPGPAPVVQPQSDGPVEETPSTVTAIAWLLAVSVVILLAVVLIGMFHELSQPGGSWFDEIQRKARIQKWATNGLLAVTLAALVPFIMRGRECARIVAFGALGISCLQLLSNGLRLPGLFWSLVTGSRGLAVDEVIALLSLIPLGLVGIVGVTLLGSLDAAAWFRRGRTSPVSGRRPGTVTAASWLLIGWLVLFIGSTVAIAISLRVDLGSGGTFGLLADVVPLVEHGLLAVLFFVVRKGYAWGRNLSFVLAGSSVLRSLYWLISDRVSGTDLYVDLSSIGQLTLVALPPAGVVTLLAWRTAADWFHHEQIHGAGNTQVPGID